MSHPIYLPAAIIQPGNTSYRAVSPPEPDNRIEDESSDLELDDAAYVLKIEREIGLGQPTEAEMSANETALYDWAEMKVDLAKANEAKIAALACLRDRVQKMAREDRFRATNLYAPPVAAAQPTISAYPLTGPNAPSVQAMKSGGVGGGMRAASHSFQYALPPEAPIESVPNSSGWQNSGEIVDRLLNMAIEADREQAETVRGGVFGGGGSITAGPSWTGAYAESIPPSNPPAFPLPR